VIGKVVVHDGLKQAGLCASGTSERSAQVGRRRRSLLAGLDHGS
jgi:hypothetical protein